MSAMTATVRIRFSRRFNVVVTMHASCACVFASSVPSAGPHFTPACALHTTRAMTAMTTRGSDQAHRARRLICVAQAVSCVLASACSAQPDATPAQVAAVHAARPALSADDQKLFHDAAALAWKYLDANYQASTGLVSATPDWPNTTLWDVGGQLVAFHAAKELGFLTQAEFDKRTKTALTTLERVPLFHGIAYTKVYSTTSPTVGAGGGRGFTATDLGRFLVAMKVLSVTEPQFADQISRVVKRSNFGPIVSGGYLHGQLTNDNGRVFSFQEGRIGYEQYIARGFKEWGANVEPALALSRNSKPVTVYGVQILSDTRFQDRLLSEPFILYGVELGMHGDVEKLASQVLRAQQARFDSTGKITIVSEDASQTPPQYFYYYCVYCNGKPYVIDAAEPGSRVSVAPWVSTKAAFGWHALMPSDYTRKAIAYVQPAADPNRGWASGVTERGQERQHAATVAKPFGGVNW